MSIMLFQRAAYLVYMYGHKLLDEKKKCTFTHVSDHHQHSPNTSAF